MILSLTYAIKKDGELMIGAILPIHFDQSGKCGKLNIEGVVIAEAIKLAVNQVNQDSKLLGKLKIPKLGYDIRDSCSHVELEKDNAYEFIREHRAWMKNKNATSKPVSVVIGAFDKKSAEVAKLLSFEDILQMSYDANNMKLNTAKKDDDTELLFSVHPEDISKMKPILDIIETKKWEYISLVGSDDKKGRDGLNMLSTELDKKNICHSEMHYVSDENSAKHIVRKLARKPRARIIVLHCDHDKSLWIFEAAKEHNMTERIWINTKSWKGKLDTIKQYTEEIEGALIITDGPQEPRGFNKYVDDLREPFMNSTLLKQTFLFLNGDVDCFDAGESKNAMNCTAARSELQKQFRKYKAQAAFAIDSVYAYAHGVQNMKTGGKHGKPLASSIKGVNFESPLTGNIIKFDKDGDALANSFILYNIQGNTSAKMDLVRVGTWKRYEDVPLKLNKKILRWKDGTDKVPSSRCSPICEKGTRREFLENSKNCCWKCIECTPGKISNVTNAASCQVCVKEYTPNPSQSKCVKYDVEHFQWFSAMGEFLIFFITAGICVGLFTLGIFSQNRESHVVLVANYKMMCFMLLGVFLCFLTPIPLLVQPSVPTCVTYVCMFNLALTIPLAVLIAKTGAVVDKFFDDEGDVKNGTLGSKPQLIIIVVVCLVQVIILLVGLNVTATEIVVYDTAKWWVKLIECSTLRTMVFWVAFGYNVVLSLLLNFLSCGSKEDKIKGNYKELKWICLTACSFYLGAFLFIVILYATDGIYLVEGVAVMIILFGFLFFFGYFWPKLYYILFTKNEEPARNTVRHSLLFGEDEGLHLGPHVSGMDAFKHHKVLQIKVKDGDSREGSKE